ncbi:hypothetical protein SRU_p0024 (plasmid) [Salinibacter ruber DSM 13855]|uniref:Uncharacterized protein n=1 Tax=Salinibacter ruber (strain DSM 13855 / M31) TaxID=309807 RepID=Q2RYJ9_SALRD|nr:hypothetical protein SRU_p0024 [Salinibacter ruber DSM 13855]
MYESSSHGKKLACRGGLFVFRADLATQRPRPCLDFVLFVVSIANTRHISFARTVGVSRRPVRIGRAFLCNSSLCHSLRYSPDDSPGWSPTSPLAFLSAPAHVSSRAAIWRACSSGRGSSDSSISNSSGSSFWRRRCRTAAKSPAHASRTSRTAVIASDKGTRAAPPPS